MDVTCKEMRRAGAWHDGELPPAEHAAFEAHLAGCPCCTREVQQLRALSGLIARNSTPE